MQLLKIRNVLSEVTSRVADKFMSEAVDEELQLTRTNSQNEICEPEKAISQLSIEDLDENMLDDESDVTNTPDEIVACKREIDVQGDVTWQRRGHRSYNGVFTILGQEMAGKDNCILMSELNIKPGKNALFAAVIKDQARIKDAAKQAECNTKEARKLRRLLRISTVDDGAYALAPYKEFRRNVYTQGKRLLDLTKNPKYPIKKVFLVAKPHSRKCDFPSVRRT
ncbi:hypothetical protein TSAR_012102 [Trichomalopsis sarcophagae]|uniref:Uncharacterized protein n=1 Tax=Trichomalopsis sarcophagae TaxID=543379 RepID=A0A232EIC7_9HYME|nr:hypothetical protein TSAR_012102 [Trichomalopsis sarcophagae]